MSTSLSSKVIEAREARHAIETIDAGANAHKSGRRGPSPAELDAAWALLERIDLPLAALCRSCVQFNQTLPRCPRDGDVNAWFAKVRLMPSDKIDDVAGAIWTDANIRVWPDLEAVLARDVFRRLAGLPPVTIYLGGPRAKREIHLRDSVRTKEHPLGRVIACRGFEYGGGGRVAILDHMGDRISRGTILRSGWSVCEGWVTTGRRSSVGGNKPEGDAVGAEKLDATPTLQVVSGGMKGQPG